MIEQIMARICPICCDDHEGNNCTSKNLKWRIAELEKDNSELADMNATQRETITAFGSLNGQYHLEIDELKKYKARWDAFFGPGQLTKWGKSASGKMYAFGIVPTDITPEALADGLRWEEP